MGCLQVSRLLVRRIPQLLEESAFGTFGIAFLAFGINYLFHLHSLADINKVRIEVTCSGL